MPGSPPPRGLARRGAIVLGAALGGFGCTTVDIDERHAFDAKRTVSEALLRSLEVTRTTTRLDVAPGVELSAWHLDQADDLGTLLYFGGNGYLMVNGARIFEGLVRAPVDVFTHDYRGYGESDGSPGVDAMKADALRVYDHVRDTLGVPPERIVVQGQSLGSFVALWVASHRPVAGVVLETPVTNVDDLLGHLAPWWTRAFITFDVAPTLRVEDNLERIESLDVPLLVLAGADDPVAHPDMARALFEAASTADKRLLVLEGANHNDLPPRADYRTALRSFVERVLPQRTDDAAPAPSRASTPSDGVVSPG